MTRHFGMRILLGIVLLETAALIAGFLAWPRGETAAPSAPVESLSDRGPGLATRAVHPAPSPSRPTGSPTAARTEVPTDEPFRPDDPVGLILFGRVLDPEGKAVERCEVQVVHDRPDAETSWGYRRDRGYFVAGLSPGRWQVVWNAEGFGRTAKEIELATTPTRVRLDVTLARAHEIKVKLLAADGRPLARALAEATERKELAGRVPVTVVATGQPLPQPIAAEDWSDLESLCCSSWRSAEDLAVERPLPAGYAGVLILMRPLPLHVQVLLGHLVLAQERLEPGRDEVVFQLDLGQLKAVFAEVRCQVVGDLDGRPIAGVRAQLTLGGTAFSAAVVQSDGEGRLVMPGRLPGPAVLNLAGQDLEPCVRSFTIEPGRPVDLGVIRLRPGTSIRGVVVDATGQPVVARVEAAALDQVSSPRLIDFRGLRPSNAEGAFECRPLGRGRHLLTFVSESRKLVARRVVDTSAGSVEGVSVVLEPWARLVLAAGVGDQRGWCVVLRDAEQDPVAVRWIWGDGVQEHHAPRGRYTAELWHGARLVRTVPITLGDRDVRIEVP